MPLISIPYSFTPNTLIASGQVDANFSALVNALNDGLGGVFDADGYVILPGSIYVQWGSATIAADGSVATSITWATEFPNAVFVVLTSIQNEYQSNPWALDDQFDSPTTDGCNLNCAGGPPSSTVTINYLAVGN